MLIRKPDIACCLLRAGLILLCIGLSLSPRASHASEDKLERIKIAFVYKFLGVIDWPHGAHPNPSSELTLGVVGDNTMLRRFSVLSGKFVDKRRLSIKRINPKKPRIGGISVLYVSKSNQKHLDQLYTNLADAPVLTITEGNREMLQSTIIVLHEKEGFIRFDINNTLARSKGIKLNAKLLELAEKVI
jgi:hypothetical protein